jgi:hypothetical protein
MSEPTVLVNFRLDRDRPLRIQWLANDGTPGDGYKAQITAIRLGDGAELHMDTSAIVEQTVADPAGTAGGYLVTFTGVVGFASDHPDRALVDRISEDTEVEYDLVFLGDDGHAALEEQDYRVLDRPTARARKLSRRA